MNIFFLDKDPKQAALFLCDQHRNKMIVESLQLICTTVRQFSNEDENKYLDSIGYMKSTHVNHGCRLWLEESNANVVWLLQHVRSLLDDYKHRRKKSHLSEQHLNTSILYIDRIVFSSTTLTSPYLAVYDELKIPNPTMDEAVDIYREYYCNKVFKDRKESHMKDGTRRNYIRPTWSDGSPSWYVPKLEIRPKWLNQKEIVYDVG